LNAILWFEEQLIELRHASKLSSFAGVSTNYPSSLLEAFVFCEFIFVRYLKLSSENLTVKYNDLGS